MIYNKKSKFGAKNHEFVTRFIRQSLDQRNLPPYEYDEKTGLVNINGHFNCNHKKLTSLRGIKFGIIRGNFSAHNNKFTNMEGFPVEVHGNFDVANNHIRSLIGAPKIVKGDFEIGFNKIESLEGCPSSIGGDFICTGNELTSLEFGPKKVKGVYFCSQNQITSLKGVPDKIKGSFDCSHNELETLEFCPSFIGGDFNCRSNNLKSLVGGPKEVKGEYDFTDNQVESFVGLCKIDKDSRVIAEGNGMSVRALETLPLYIKNLDFESNDPFIGYSICSEFIEMFLENRSLALTIPFFKEGIRENVEEKKRDMVDTIASSKRRIKEAEEELAELKESLVNEEEEYLKIKDISAEEFINSFASQDLQKGVGALKRFGVF